MKKNRNNRLDVLERLQYRLLTPGVAEISRVRGKLLAMKPVIANGGNGDAEEMKKLLEVLKRVREDIDESIRAIKSDFTYFPKVKFRRPL